MKNIIITLLLFFVNNLFGQKENAPKKSSSEFKLNQNGSSLLDLFAFGQLEKKVYKKLGVWSFLYLDQNYAEIVTGPCYSTPHFTIGAGYGYDFFGQTTVLAGVTKLRWKKYDAIAYAEDSEGWYWYYGEINRSIKKDNLDIGIYHQAGIGTGIQTRKHFSKEFSFTFGISYRQNDIGYNRSPIIGKFCLNYSL